MRIICLNADFTALDLTGADVMITDPPYSDHVHASAVSTSGKRGTRKRDLGFDPLTDDLRACLCTLSQATRRWSVIFTDVETAHLVRDRVNHIRTIPWVRWSMPQLSGDRPTTGQEKMVFAHGAGTDLVVSHEKRPGRMHWNGPGNLTHFAHTCMRGEDRHKAEKPLDLILDLVEWFSDPGEIVVDPFGGHGTTAVACAILGRSCISVEIDPVWHAKTEYRVNEATAGRFSKTDQKRIEKWQASKST